jgi:hypothetical protein
MKLTISKVSNGALMKIDMNKNETESGEREQSERVFVFDEDKPEGIIEMLHEIFDSVLWLGDDKYEEKGTQFVCELIETHGRKYDTTQCQPGCKLCSNTKIVKDFRNACSKEKA